jgi:NAD(P)-dependent dehydrogenase (short-subunit alcohol dehydrogenase family)
MSSTHAGKVAVITGGGRGLGRTMGLALLGAGANVVLVDVDDAVLAEAEAAARDLGAADRVLKVNADVSHDETGAVIVAAAMERFGKVDILINNAGVGLQQVRPAGAPVLSPYMEVTPAEFRRMYEINTIGFFLMSLAVLPGMRARNWGRVINVTTSLDTMMRLFPYGGTKAACEANTAMLAAELEGSGVTGNVLIPGGAVATRLALDMFTGEKRARLIQPDVMISPVLWLTSEAADGVNGRRFNASLWDAKRGDAENIAAAGAPCAWPGLGRAANV